MIPKLFLQHFEKLSFPEFHSIGAALCKLELLLEVKIEKCSGIMHFLGRSTYTMTIPAKDRPNARKSLEIECFLEISSPGNWVKFLHITR